MLVPGSEFDEWSPQLDLALRSLRLYSDFVRELEAESGLSIDYSVCGSIEVALDGDTWRGYQTRAGRQAALGIANQLLDANAIRDAIRGFTCEVAGGVLYPEEGQVDPRTVIVALRTACRHRGVVLREHTAVDAITPGARVTLSTGECVAAGAIVLASGAWTTAIAGTETLPAAFPVRGHLLGYLLAPGSLPHVIRCGHTYVVQRRTGYTIAGASEERVGFDRALDDDTVAQLASDAHGMLGDLVPAAPADRWIGFRPGVDAAGPQIGRIPGTRIYAAYGHYRNGILLAPVTAELLAADITSSSRKD